MKIHRYWLAIAVLLLHVPNHKTQEGLMDQEGLEAGARKSSSESRSKSEDSIDSGDSGSTSEKSNESGDSGSTSEESNERRDSVSTSEESNESRTIDVEGDEDDFEIILNSDEDCDKLKKEMDNNKISEEQFLAFCSEFVNEKKCDFMTLAEKLDNRCSMSIVQLKQCSICAKNEDSKVDGLCCTGSSRNDKACPVYVTTIDEIIKLQCYVTLIRPGCMSCGPIQVDACDTCWGPVRIDRTTQLDEKSLCDGDLSRRTVHGLSCMPRDGKANSSAPSSCMMGGEGYSFCDTEYLFYRNGHWVDWDLCSLCTADDKTTALSTGGFTCDSRCTNTWNNRAIKAPRCKVLDPGPNDPEYDYCTTCQGDECVSVVIDNRPGDVIKPYGFGGLENEMN